MMLKKEHHEGIKQQHTCGFTGLLIILFAYTGITKLIQHDTFVIALSHAPVTGKHAAVWAWFIPIVEILVSLLLSIPIRQFRVTGLVASFLLMVVFTSYLLLMIVFVPDLPCSCGGVISRMTWPQHLVFNIFFTLLSAAAVWLSLKDKLFIAINRQSRNPV